MEGFTNSSAASVVQTLCGDTNDNGDVGEFDGVAVACSEGLKCNVKVSMESGGSTSDSAIAVKGMVGAWKFREHEKEKK